MASRAVFNEYLENWYNADGGEEPVFVRYHHLLGPSQGEFAKREVETKAGDIEYCPKIVDRVNNMVKQQLNRLGNSTKAIDGEWGGECQEVGFDETDLRWRNADTTLESLGLDSLDRMDLSLLIERQFGHRNTVVAEHLGQLWAMAQGIGVQIRNTNMVVPISWFAHRNKTCLATVSNGDSIGEAFLHRAINHLDDTIVNDSHLGALTHRRMLVAVRLFSKEFAKLPEKHVGVLLPASVAADIVFFSLVLANKIPVLLNWTTGPSNLTHAAKQTSIQHIVTSKAFIDRLNLQMPNVAFIFMEQLKSQISTLSAFRELIITYVNVRLSNATFSPPNQDETAVLLFTSGSETTPKTVPLSHRNLLVNLRDGLAAFDADTHDSVLGFLPPFHSFGLLANLLLPHLIGIRCTRFADPTDVHALKRLINAYKPSLLFTTPTLLARLLSICSLGDMDSLRKIVTGAERCPEGVIQLSDSIIPKATVLEGYGITECSPVISLNTLAARKRGTTGKPIASVETRVIDVDSGVVVPAINAGMLIVSGPSIFSGYLNYDGPSPFIEMEGKTWYKTGDIVSIDEEGFISIRGRLKRFLKAGGEMISLPALEEPFTRIYPATDLGPRVAVEGIETENSRYIVLFSTQTIALSEVTRIVFEAGFRGVMRIDEVRRIESIPLLGTGKVDYKQLRSMLSDEGVIG